MSDTRFCIVSDIDLPLDPQTQQRALLGDISAIVKLGDCFFYGWHRLPKDYHKAVEFYSIAASKNNISANRKLAECYEEGKGVAKNLEIAFRLYLNAANLGDYFSQFKLGLYYYEKKTDINLKEAVKWFYLSAEQGYSEAQYYLGYCYFNGLGVVEDKNKAIRWLTKSAYKSNTKAMVILSTCYANGISVCQHCIEALKWLYKSEGFSRKYFYDGTKFHKKEFLKKRDEILNIAEGKYYITKYEIGLLFAKGEDVVQSPIEAFKWVSFAAEEGYASAQYTLASYYELGFGVNKDCFKATEWYCKAAEQGNPEAKYRIGELCYEGQCMPQNSFKAFKYFMYAADCGVKKAYSKIAECYANGKGVPKDSLEAITWWIKAAENGDEESKIILAKRFKEGDGISKNPIEAIKWYREIAQTNIKYKYELAKYLLDGIANPENFKEAFELLTQAARCEHIDAQFELGQCYLFGKGVKKNYKEAHYWNSKAAKNGSSKALGQYKRLKFLSIFSWLFS